MKPSKQHDSKEGGAIIPPDDQATRRRRCLIELDRGGLGDADEGQAKGRRESGTFYALPTAVVNSQNFCQLSGKACRLLLDLLTQIRIKTGGPSNNGDLCITLSVMKQRGWKSKQQLEEARDELEHYEFIVRTRQGGKRIPNLYGFTWLAINECGGKLEPPFNQGTKVPPGGWKEPKPYFVSKRKKITAPHIGPKSQVLPRT